MRHDCTIVKTSGSSDSANSRNPAEALNQTQNARSGTATESPSAIGGAAELCLKTCAADAQIENTNHTAMIPIASLRCSLLLMMFLLSKKQSVPGSVETAPSNAGLRVVCAAAPGRA